MNMAQRRYLIKRMEEIATKKVAALDLHFGREDAWHYSPDEIVEYVRKNFAKMHAPKPDDRQRDIRYITLNQLMPVKPKYSEKLVERKRKEARERKALILAELQKAKDTAMLGDSYEEAMKILDNFSKI